MIGPVQYKSAKAALEQIAIVCTDNMDRSCDHRMALDFVRQVANDYLDDAQSSQVSTLAKLADKWRVQAKQYDEAAKECYDRGDDDEGDMNDIEGSALFRCATELDTALKSLAAQPPAAPVEFDSLSGARKQAMESHASMVPAAPVETGYNLATGERDNEETDPTYFHCSADIGEIAHWIASPMKDVGTIEQFHEVVDRAEQALTGAVPQEAPDRAAFDLLVKTLRDIGEFNSADATTLSAIQTLAMVRNKANVALVAVGSPALSRPDRA